MSGFGIDPISNGDLYDSILLGGLKSPGKVTLSGHDRKVDWDVKVVPGTKGATTTIKSIPPVEFTATFYLVRDDAIGVNDFDAWPQFLAKINSTVDGAKPKPLDIYHPDLAANGIISVCKSFVGGVVHDGKGGQTITVRFMEYKPPAPAKTPRPSSDPDAAAKAEIKRLTKQYEATPWG